MGLAPVGFVPGRRDATGLLDMAGNAAEWVFDWYERDEQQFGYPRAAQSNPKGPAIRRHSATSFAAARIRDGAHWLRAAARRACAFAEREIGFRCAADLR